MLLRRYIGQRLQAYFAQAEDAVVGGLSPLQLSSLWGRWHWLRVYQRLYRDTNGQWLTPVELFQPHYSQVIANYIIDSSSQDEGPIEIHEIGGGRGTNARALLDHIASVRPDVYQRLSKYRLVDGSPSLLKLQQRVLGTTAHADKFCYTYQDVLSVAEGKDSLFQPSSQATFVIGLELLDNLPHDKIRIRGKVVEQAIIRHQEPSRHSRFEEIFVPLDDPLISRVLKMAPASRNSLRCTWVPTVLGGFLRHLYRQCPQAHVIFADFDWLPGPNTDQPRRSKWADGEPLVTDMNDVDFACYLAPQKALCDILFPTDFDYVADMLTTASKGAVLPVVQKQTDFLQQYGPEQVRATQSWLSGFTPLLGDFGNCSVLTTTVPHA